MGSSILSITNPDEEILLAQCDALLPRSPTAKSFRDASVGLPAAARLGLLPAHAS